MLVGRPDGDLNCQEIPLLRACVMKRVVLFTNINLLLAKQDMNCILELRFCGTVGYIQLSQYELFNTDIHVMSGRLPLHKCSELC